MAKKTTTTKGAKKKQGVKKIPYQYQPEGMTLREWQVKLRQQAARDGIFAVREADRKRAPGEYVVRNPESHEEYKVVFRGEGSPWNYCSCMDFKTSLLGTCKHLEAVKLWTAEGHRVHTTVPPYTSVYLDYTAQRKVRIRIGQENRRAFETLAAEYFDEQWTLKPEAIDRFDTFLRRARQVSPSFRCYRDALELVIEQREQQVRRRWVDEMTDADFDDLLHARLYPYQQEGIRFAAKAGRAIIADEMGLGKTIQAIGTAELLRRKGLVGSVLILCPTSLKYQWKREIERFTGQRALVIEGVQTKRRAQYQGDESYKIVSYNAACNDIKVAGRLETDMVIIDEVQRLKNWKTQIARAARKIVSHYAVILSGTPLENRLEELFSVVELVDQYRLGPYYLFRDRYIMSDQKGAIIGYKNLNEIGKMLAPILIRRRKKDVSLQLPERQDQNLMVPMTREQMAIHDEAKVSVSQLMQKWERMHFLSESDRNRLMMHLQQMRMVCDSTFILDQKTRYDTKVDEVMSIIASIVDSGDEKVVVFSQWERMTRLIARELEDKGIGFEYLHGGIASKARKDLVNNFTDLPESRVFLSTDAGSTGLNLQVASYIINIDLPWNPAVLEQRIARIYRIGQKRNIQVINLVAANTFEEQMLGKLRFKTSMFEGVLDGGEDTVFASQGKFNQIMEELHHTMQAEETRNHHDDEQPIDINDGEPKADEAAHEARTATYDEEEAEVQSTEATETPHTADDSPTAPQPSATTETAARNATAPHGSTPGVQHPRQLVEQGMSFFAQLAETLQSEEATQQLVDTLVESDPETGESRLSIPVPDKASVTAVLGMIGKLLSNR